MNPDALLGLPRRFQVEGVAIQALDGDGLLKTISSYRDKDRIDRARRWSACASVCSRKSP